MFFQAPKPNRVPPVAFFDRWASVPIAAGVLLEDQPRPCFSHSLPQPFHVTNNLYRGKRKAQNWVMREVSPNQSGQAPASKAPANSLFRKILPASPFISRFCPDHPLSKIPKSFESKILPEPSKKNQRYISPRRPPESRKPKAESRTPEAESRKPTRCKMSRQSLTDHLPASKGFLPWQR